MYKSTDWRRNCQIISPDEISLLCQKMIIINISRWLGTDDRQDNVLVRYLLFSLLLDIKEQTYGAVRQQPPRLLNLPGIEPSIKTTLWPAP